MAINLASKYSDKLVEQNYRESFIQQSRLNNGYDFHGVKSLTVYTPVTVDLSNYNRTATANRFGTPTEMQDTVQEMTMSQDKGFSITIDRGNNSDQLLIKEAGRMMALQTREKVTPMMDKYTFSRWIAGAGTTKAYTAAALTKATIIGAISEAATQMDNDLVPADGRTLYIGASQYNALRLSNEFLAVDTLADKSLTKGMVGRVFDMDVIKVPDSYLDGAHFLITQKEAVLRPVKLKTARILKEVAGIDGAVLEGRYYYDAFVLNTKNRGVYAATVASVSS